MDENVLPSVVEFDEDPREADAPVPLPPGRYPATIVKVENREAKSREGGMTAHVHWQISADSYPPDWTDGDPEGTVVRSYIGVGGLDGRGKYRLGNFLKAIQAPGGKRIDLADWVGLEAVLETDVVPDLSGDPNLKQSQVKQIHKA